MLLNDDNKPCEFPPIDPKAFEGIRQIFHKGINDWCANPNMRHEKFQASNFVGKSAIPAGWDATPPLKALLEYYRKKNPKTADGETGKCVGYILKDVLRKEPRTFEKSKAKVTQYRLVDRK